MSRKQVEDYLQRKGAKFTQMCCVGKNTGTFDDLVKVGRENPPFYCIDRNIYVAFQFSGDEHLGIPKVNTSDRLGEVTLFEWLDGCP